MPNHCARCPSLCASRTQIVQPDTPDFGRPCKLLVIGEAPGADEDREGKGFVGRSGRMLHHLLEEQGLRRGYDYGCANIVRCRPPENRKPTAEEIWNCLPRLADTILQAHPTALLLVGGTAVSVFLGGGTLAHQVAASRGFPAVRFGRFSPSHPILAKTLASLQEIVAIPMPHTSPLAWNRKSKDGTPWSAIGREQVKQAAQWTKRQPPCPTT
ncbi:uracil-DNA glycosylase [Acidithiobacillus ferridurans]|uniref:Uracil-DNA glycosylase n=1 Tax=Acidithiobacillus ferridurans TaxID=1232575 RepID=A0A8X8KD49_ACIFI|nr:uracil-DNA glycosylase [Acidithiobacillus ferridurans]MBU2714585.1 uracil-DNA glycosylase [Acidithiobacillus ferridurans]MBU2724793.1 uracil-DNA glycosylase [Acidithiobacillus ferridurans]MBU2725853.1 uracil-DNA glycosylase [Acidithiobacillus ferridurans]